MRRHTRAARDEEAAEEKRRLEAHREDAEANPLSDGEVQLWLRSLNALDSAAGKPEQLAICRELLRHAPDDDMLSSDERIIKMAVTQLEEELARETTPGRRPVRVRVPDGVCGDAEDDAGADDAESPADPFLGYDESE